MWNKQNHAFFRYQAKRNFRFNFNFRFRSENEGAPYTDKKENQTFLIYREIQSGAVAKSYMGKGFLIYEEMRKYFPIYVEPLVIYDFATAPLWISLHMRKIWFSFLSVYYGSILTK